MPLSGWTKLLRNGPAPHFSKSDFEKDFLANRPSPWHPTRDRDFSQDLANDLSKTMSSRLRQAYQWTWAKGHSFGRRFGSSLYASRFNRLSWKEFVNFDLEISVIVRKWHGRDGFPRFGKISTTNSIRNLKPLSQLAFLIV